MIRTASAAAGPPGTTQAGRMPLRTLVLAVAAGWLAVSIVLGISTQVSGLLAGRPLALYWVFGESLLSGAVWTPATVAAFLLTWRFPVDRGSIVRNALIHLAWGVAVVTAKVAVYHYAGQAMGVLRREVPLRLALSLLGAESLFTYVLLVGVAHAFAYARTIRERELGRAQLETQLVQAQLQTLKAQLHPHFLFNTLHAISTLVHADPDRAEQVVASLSDMLRNTLAHQHDQEVTLRDELATLEPYLQIEKTRLGARLAVETRVDEATLDACVPHLLLQPLVENAIKHGIGPRRAPGHIRITGGMEGARLLLTVEDDGRGISGPPRPGALGLHNTRARLQRLYGAAHDFALHSAPGQGTRVEVRIPFRRAPREIAAGREAPAAAGGRGSSSFPHLP